MSKLYILKQTLIHYFGPIVGVVLMVLSKEKVQRLSPTEQKNKGLCILNQSSVLSNLDCMEFQ